MLSEEYEQIVEEGFGNQIKLRGTSKKTRDTGITGLNVQCSRVFYAPPKYAFLTCGSTSNASPLPLMRI